jgi:hypothetical protein
MMTDRSYTIRDSSGQPVSVIIQRDRRLRKSARWERQPNGAILLRIPHRLPTREIGQMLAKIERQMARQQRRVHQTDADLQARAERLNIACFEGAIRWESIRWVGNMRHRLGSCTQGGSTDGHIRISDRIRDWPDWVIDYVIVHELTHRIHPDHSAAFWNTLTTAYPLTDRARGFIQGVGFASQWAFEEDT